MGKVNSESYWDDRFKTDWDENQGDKQSIFFIEIALGMFPKWLHDTLSTGNKSVCDWGCAEGDGTYLLAKKFPKSSFEGIDFAETAIKSANKRYQNGNLSFTTKDLLTQKHDKSYDIIFSSNVFEHFVNPWEVFDKISTYANDLFIMMVPFEEDPKNLIPEHFHSFDKKDFKLTNKSWDIIHFSVRDTSVISDTLWNGRQALVIFAKKDYSESLKLNFDEIDLSVDASLNQAHINEKAIATYKKENDELVARAASLEASLNKFKQQSSARRYRAADKIANATHVVINKIPKPTSLKKRKN